MTEGASPSKKTLDRRRLNVVETAPHPAYVVWELTLRCDHACTHCGSRASAPRERELTTPEALAVARDLAKQGAREVVLIGGEAYLHEGFLDVVRELVANDVRVALTTGGRGIDDALARAMKEAGVHRVSVSVDGLEETHDLMRNLRGSFASAMAAMSALASADISIASNININRLNHADLEALYEVLRVRGVRSWQIQLTAPLGRAADRPQMLLQPWDLLTLVPRIAALKTRAFGDGVLISPGNNLGYFGPEEGLLRSNTPGGADHFRGCLAGRFVLGVESNGDVKGCPSLQSTEYVGGNVRERSLDEIWRTAPELAFTRDRDLSELWGYCGECAYASVCQGGCSFTAHAFFGKRGNNPYCYHRARVFDKRGLRERLVPTLAAKGTPFDHGLFEIVVEDRLAPEPEAPTSRDELVRLTRKSQKAVRVAIETNE